MKRAFFTLFASLSFFSVQAQMADDFEDNDLSIAPEWTGMDTSFLNVSGVLKSRHKITNSAFYISSAFHGEGSLIWILDIQLGFNTSSLNYADFVLISDNRNLLSMGNGLFVRLGGISDEISLFSTKDGIDSKLVDGKDGLLNNSSNHYRLKIIYESDTLTLMHQKSGQTTYVKEGSVALGKLSSHSHSGIRVRQSSSGFFNKHSFDDFYAGEFIRDSISPTTDSIRFQNDSILAIYFNEECDSVSLLEKSSYQINGNLNPVNIRILSGNRSVLLTFIPLPLNTYFDLGINGIQDLEGNEYQGLIKNCINYACGKAGKHSILITEIMADPDPSAGLPLLEYIEIQNVTQDFVLLSELSICDPGQCISLPPYVLHPDSIFVLYNVPSLNNSSDQIYIKDKQGLKIDEVSYNDKWYRDNSLNNGGYSLELIDISRTCIKEMNWMASKALKGGTPGKKNSVASKLPPDSIAPRIVRYELMKNSRFKFYLDDIYDSSSQVKFELSGKPMIPLLQTVNMVDYGLIYKMPFEISLDSDYHILVAGYRDCEQNISGKKYFHFHWPGMAVKGDIVINEVLFNPVSGGSDFIELYNRGNSYYNLSEIFIADLNMDGSTNHIYPLSEIFRLFGPGEYLLFSADTIQVCSQYQCGKNSVRLQIPKMPVMSDDAGGLMILNLSGNSIDSFWYNEKMHFKPIVDKNGVSLERLSPDMNSNDHSNWHSAATNAGYASPGRLNSQHWIPVEPTKFFTPATSSFSPDLDGHDDLMIYRYQLPEADYIANIKIFDITGRLVRYLYNSGTLGTEGIISWDGTDDQETELSTGIYIITFECYKAGSVKIREKASVVLLRTR